MSIGKGVGLGLGLGMGMGMGMGVGLGRGMGTVTETETETDTGTGTGPGTDTGYLAVEHSLDFTLFTGYNNCWTAYPIELHTSSSAFSTVLAYSRYQIYA